jgi:murein DD-endopeptidase MepM/ murein hydrolase activator NlpD
MLICKEGSVLVKVGDEIEAGQQIGQLGNSGGSSAPHLHFHVVLGPSPIASNSVPYVFDSFNLAGMADPNDLERAVKGKGPLFIRTQPPIAETQELPLDYVVVDFPTPSP